MDDGKFGIAVSDISTGEFRVTELSGEEAVTGELTRLSPRECLLPEKLSKDKHFAGLIEQLGIVVTVVEDWKFLYDSAYRVLTSLLQTQSLDGFGVEGKTAAVGSAGAMISCLEETQKTSLSHINKMTVYSVSDFMEIKRISLSINQGYLICLASCDFADYCYRARGCPFYLINDLSTSAK